MKDFELLQHTADIKIRSYGRTLEECFKNALVGMFQSIKPHANGCRQIKDRIICPNLPISREVDLHSYDREMLLVDFLSHALYLSDVHNEAYLDAIIEQLTDDSIRAKLLGVKVTGFEVVEIKAVTYHDLKIIKHNGIWTADIVFDI